MELDHNNTIDKLKRYLIRHGYPKESLALEFKMGRYRVDLAVIDPSLNIPVQIFEIKTDEKFLDQGIGQARRFRSELNRMGKLDVPIYLVFPKKEEPGFKIINVDKYSKEVQDIDLSSTDLSMLDYNLQKTGRISEKISETSDKREDTADHFKYTCWILGVIVSILFLLDYFGKMPFEISKIPLLVIAIGLFLMPYGSKLKLIGMEFERLKQSK
ncbi:hypothetical protein [Methanococcus maripaludis]|uniref:Uncharacterized protein n=1 Tax=Methanococcus maripaludis TaxID=39152 RepID=A0A7J9SDL6_METMI|nr:hypothetical protein [Methanococcus maripaludis]MBB6497775.1 hypothetical protein [Methanococcus maripaludis]